MAQTLSEDERLLAEVESVAEAIGQRLRATLEWVKKEYQVSAVEACRRVTEENDPAWAELARTAPVSELGWRQLEALEQHEPGAGYARWQEVKEYARRDLLSGQLAARVATADTGEPLVRAQFLALMNNFLDDWQPRNAIERSLLETLASAYSQWQYWLGAAENWKGWEHENWDKRKREHAHHVGIPPRVSYVEAADRCIEMADRWNRIFLRNVRALRDLRRYSVTILNAPGGQVNVAQQQVNVSGRNR